MKRRKARSKRMQITQLWARSDAVKAIPYLRSIIASLRENYLEVLNAERRLDLANQKQSAPKRQQILDRETHEDDARRARAKFNDGLEELSRIGVFLLEPVHGIALIPFRKGDDLAWYVFDQFAVSGLIGWRTHSDPIDECRPMTSLDDAATLPLAS
jgi:hypothetical protein